MNRHHGSSPAAICCSCHPSRPPAGRPSTSLFACFRCRYIDSRYPGAARTRKAPTLLSYSSVVTVASARMHPDVNYGALTGVVCCLRAQMHSSTAASSPASRRPTTCSRTSTTASSAAPRSSISSSPPTGAPAASSQLAAGSKGASRWPTPLLTAVPASGVLGLHTVRRGRSVAMLGGAAGRSRSRFSSKLEDLGSARLQRDRVGAGDHAQA